MDYTRASRAWIGNESTRDGGVQATKARGPSGESARALGARVDARVGAGRAANAHDARELIDARVDASVED